MPRTSKARTTDAEQVRQVLQKLQDGYLKRNLASLDYYMKELFPSDGRTTIIGTSGLLPEDAEWPRNRDGVRKLLESDWRNWGDVYFNVASAKVEVGRGRGLDREQRLRGEGHVRTSRCARTT